MKRSEKVTAEASRANLRGKRPGKVDREAGWCRSMIVAEFSKNIKYPPRVAAHVGDDRGST